MKNAAIDQARSLYYKFFGIVFDFIDKEEKIDHLLTLVTLFEQNPMDEVSLNALGSMKEFLKVDGFRRVKEESDDLFVSPDSVFIPISASYYDEGRDDGRKRVEVTDLVASSTFRKNEFVCNESEDNIAFLCQFTQALLSSSIKEEDSKSFDLARKVFEDILNDFIDEFITLLFKHENGIFYKNVAILLKSFIEFERIYLVVSPSQKEVSKERASAALQVDRKPLTKRIRRDLDEIVL